MSSDWSKQILAADDPHFALGVYADWLDDRGNYDLAEYVRSLWEQEIMISPPFKVGEQYLICTVTLYYVGRVVEIGPGWIRLEQASWIHWTGRLGELLQGKSFSKLRGRRARTEPCGEVGLATSILVSWYPWKDGELPKEAIQ